MNQIKGLLTPHRFSPTLYSFNGTAAKWKGIRLPRVLIPLKVLNVMQCYIDLADMEVGWLGTVNLTGEGDFIIDEVFLPTQISHWTQANITDEGVYEVYERLLNQGKRGEEKIPRIRFWGHSHVFGSTTPSVRDDDQVRFFAESMKNSDTPFFLRGIGNKLGMLEFAVFLFDAELVIVDAEWQIYRKVPPALRRAIETELDQKVTQVDQPIYVPRPSAQENRWKTFNPVVRKHYRYHQVEE